MDIANLVIRVTNEGLDRARADLDRLRGEASRSESAISKMGNNLKRVAKYSAVAMGAMGAASAVSLLKASDSMQALNNQIRVATDGAAEYAIAQSEIERIAMSTYSSLSSVGELYASNERALGSMGKSQQDVLLFTENISKAMSISGGSAESQAAALTQLGQAMASGVLRGDEFNSIAEQAPVLMDLLTESLGVTRGELRKMAADGAITAEIVYDAVSGASDSLDGMMGQTVTTMSQAMTNVKTQWSKLSDDLFNTEGGIGEGLAQGINNIALGLQAARVWLDEFLSRAETIAFMQAIAENVATAWNTIKDAIGGAVTAITEFLKKPETIEAIKATIDGLEMAWDNLKSVIERTGEIISPVIEFFREHEELSKSLATAIGIVAAGFVIYNAAVVIGTAVTGGFVAVLSLVTAPITLIVVAMTALVAAGIYVYRNWDEIKAKAIEIWGAIKTYISDKIAETKQAIVDKWEQIKSDAVTYLNILKIVMSNKFQEIKYKTSQKFTEIKESIITTLKELPGKLLQVGKDIVQGLINGIKSGVSGVTTAISDMASGAVTKAKDVLGIKSPSRVMMGVGSDFSQGFINGIKGKSDEVRKTAIQQAQSAIDGVKGSIATLKKEIALFGNDGPLASFEYDVSIGKYKDVNAELIEQYRQRIIQMQRLVELDKQQTEQIKLQKAANASIYSSIESMNRQLYEMGGERSPLEMLVWDLENTSKHANASAEAIDNLKDKTKELFEQQQAQDSAKRANEAAAGLAGVKGDLLGLNDNPVQRIVDDYEHRLAAIAEYEQTHQKILQESADKQIEIERLKNMALQDMALASGEIIAGDMASIFKDMLGEQSKGYRAMFAIEKGFAIAQGAIAIQRNISAAMATGFPQNIPLIAGAIAQGASLMSNIKGITAGFKQGGYTGNMGASQVAGVVHGQEYVFDAQSTKRIGVDNLNAMRSGKSVGGGDVNISVNVDAKGNSSVQGDNERMGRDMANGIKAVVMDVMRKEKRQGGMLYA